MEENLNLAPYIVKKVFGVKSVFDEDLCSVAYMALCSAAHYYREGVGCAFSTYAAVTIQNALRRYKGDNATEDWFSRISIDENLSREEDSGAGDESSNTLRNKLPDRKMNVEETVINRVLYEIAAPHMPTFVDMEETGLSAKAYARKIHKRSYDVERRLTVERRHAYAALNGGEYPAEGA